MARPLRIEYEGAVYHVTARGNERGKIFFAEADYRKLKDYIASAKEKFELILHAYVLMTNHYHLIIETPGKNLSKIMHFINSSYTTHVNIKRKRTGHLFQGRYKAILVDRDHYLLELSRYLHLNPVRAKMTPKPEDYPYSSYRAYITGQPESLVDTDLILGMLGGRRGDAPGRYKAFVESAVEEEIENPLRKIYGGVILGGKGFIRETLRRIESEHAASPEISWGKALRAIPDIEDIVSVCCAHFDVTREELKSSRRSDSRKVCVYLIKKHTSATNREIAEIFGSLSYSAVAKIDRSVSSRLATDDDLRELIERMQVEYSLFKA